MLTVSILLLAASTPGPDRLDFQIMTSPAYVAFAAKGERACPARKLRYLHPADLDEIEEDFLPTLSRRDRRRVAAVNPGSRGCSGGGISCPAQNMLAAIAKAQKLDAFVGFACASTI